MAQHDYVIANQSGSSFRSDLNNALSAIVSQNSGSSEPSTTYAYQTWADTTAGVMKMRNGANSAWITLYQLDGEWSTIAFENGTAAAPSIYFKDSGTDTGFYSPGTDQVGITTGGTARLTIDASGNVNIDSNTLYVDAANNRVGLGTSSPQDILHLSKAGDLYLRVTNTSTNINAYLGQDSNGTYIGNTGAADVRFIQGSTERMRLTSTGLGIGITSPSGIFHAKAGTNANLVVDNNGGGGGALRISALNDAISANTDFQLQGSKLFFVTGGSERARLDDSGRLLVGTSTAQGSANIQIQGGADSAKLYLRRDITNSAMTSSGQVVLGSIDFGNIDGAVGARIQANNDTDSGWANNDYPSRLVFSTTADGASSPTERMRISSTGVVTCTANAAGEFALNIDNDGNNANRYGLKITCGLDNASGTNYPVEFYDGDGTSQGFITFSGGTVTYGAFTAHHPCILPEQDNEHGYPYGTLLETIAIAYSEKNGVATERGIRYKVRKTQTANSKTVLGAYGSSMNNGPNHETNLHQALVLGDGHILCNGSGGNIKVGDGICSSAVAGIGQKATATPSMIIGIAQEDITFDGDETKLVPVQYGLQQFIPWQD